MLKMRPPLEHRECADPVVLVASIPSVQFPAEVAGYREYRVVGDVEASPPMLPLGAIQIIFQMGTSWWHRPCDRQERERRLDAFVGGPFDKGYELAGEPGARIFSIELRPGRAGAFLAVPPDLLRGLMVPPRDIWGPAVDDLIERIRQAASTTARARLAERFLAAHYRPIALNAVDHAVLIVQQMRQDSSTKPPVSVAQLSRAVGLSVAQLRKRFTRQVGVAPKPFIRARRLAALSAYAFEHRDISLTELAHDFGYSDQSHLIHDFRSMTGQTPGQFLRQASRACTCPPATVDRPSLPFELRADQVRGALLAGGRQRKSF